MAHLTHRDVFPEPDDVAELRAWTEREVYGVNIETSKAQIMCPSENPDRGLAPKRVPE